MPTVTTLASTPLVGPTSQVNAALANLTSSPMSSRLLLTTDIPRTLWDADTQCLTIPRSLADAYQSVLSERNLLEAANDNVIDDGPVGGITEADTHKHFAHRFASSAARTQLALLDPDDVLCNVSNQFVRAFAGGHVGLLDLPCGAGAASLDLLATIAALRQSGAIPRQPLYVHLLAADISKPARDIFLQLAERIRADLASQGIILYIKPESWDALDSESTTQVLDSWLKWATSCSEHFVLLANFSGFLQRDGKFRDAQPQLHEVMRWVAQQNSTLVWIEPQTNTATQHFLPRLLGWLNGKLPRRFREGWHPGEADLSAEARYQHPIKSDCRPTVRLVLIRLEAAHQ